VGGFPHRVKKSMSVSGLSCKRPRLALDRHYFSPPLHKQQSSDLIVPPFLTIKFFSSVCMDVYWLRAVTVESSLMSWCCLSHKSVQDGFKG